MTPQYSSQTTAQLNIYPGNLLMVVAPSGAGKSSLVSRLLAQDPAIQLSISYTTRAPRPGEQDGREYHFTTVDDFVARRDHGEFLEWAKVHGNFYGTSKIWIAQQMMAGTDVLLEIDWQGAKQVRAQFTNAVEIFILPPSLTELERRLRHRAQDTDDVITRRIAAAGAEIAYAPQADYVIINDTFETALAQLQSVVTATRLRVSSQRARQAELFEGLGIR